MWMIMVMGLAMGAEWEGVEYARVDAGPLLLDLYVPQGKEPAPLMVWVHGGAWRAGSRGDVPVAGLADRGIAIASVDYRLSPVARFPAQAHDIHAAIRYLRAHADRYGYDAERIVIAGSSAGGHLATLVGVSSGVGELEGSVGDDRQQSSRVMGIVCFYGASNLHTILAQSTPHGLKVRVPALELLLGGTPDQKPDLARAASPVAHVDRSDPPVLWIHGDQDPQMPINQAHEMQGKCNAAGVPFELVVVHGGAHGGPQFYTNEMLDRVAAFVQTTTSNKTTER